MASGLRKRLTLRRKLSLLRTLINSKSVKKNSIIMDAFLYISILKLKLEAFEREYLDLLKHIKEVKVEKIGEGFLVRMSCRRGKYVLVSILEALDRMSLNVLQTSVSCNYFFRMEAIVEGQDQGIDARDITQAVLQAIDQGLDDI